MYPKRGIQTVGGVIFVSTGVGLTLIISTKDISILIVVGIFAVGTGSTIYGISNTEEGLIMYIMG